MDKKSQILVLQMHEKLNKEIQDKAEKHHEVSMRVLENRGNKIYELVNKFILFISLGKKK